MKTLKKNLLIMAAVLSLSATASAQNHQNAHGSSAHANSSMAPASMDHANMNHSTAQNDKQSVIATKGVVKKIDTEAKKVTIDHEPIPAINWPAMTMRFTYENPDMIKDLKEGQSVQFEFVQQGNLSLLEKIDVIQ